MKRTRIVLFLLTTGTAAAGGASAQTTGSVLGRIVQAETGTPLEGASIRVVDTELRAASSAEGRFLLGAVPAGERTLRIERIGHRTVVLEGVIVRAGRAREVVVEMEVAPLAVEGVRVDVRRQRLVEPDVSGTHQVVPARELRALPVDRMDDVIELTPGVSGGHFRGGRVGQEVHVVDGLELKNPFDAAAAGAGMELSPTSLDEVDVITGGFGAQYGSALSGVVTYATRRGNPERWETRAAVLSDEWAPSTLSRGFNSFSASAGGPLGFLGGGTTLFVDVLAQGMLDAEPRARGLTCLTEADADEDLAAEIARVRAAAPSLLCPREGSVLPHQRGDRLIGFARVDRALTRSIDVSAKLLRNRFQQQLYTPEFRYSRRPQLGRRSIGTLGTLSATWSGQSPARAQHVVASVGLMRLDRYLGPVDPVTFDAARPARFGFGDYRFIGEDAARAPIEEQLASPAPLPGYVAPGGSRGSPFGIAGTGIFRTEGTSHIASYARTDVLTIDLTGEVLNETGSSFRSGGAVKLHRVESYERTLSHITGSLPGYARFYPATVSGFGQAHVAVDDEITFDVGLRIDAFRSGLTFLADRSDFMSPVLDASWNLSVNPRLGLSLPVPGTDEAVALRLNYGYVSQPPDFRYFLDTGVGDSLRTDIRRQGNPALSFERGKSYEVGLSALIGASSAAGLTLFRKELGHLVSGSMRLGATGDPVYTTDDEGTVQGAEVTLRGQWSAVSLRAGYALQKATGLASGTDSDSLIGGDPIEYPLAFDRRHSFDAALAYGRPAGAESPWSAVLTTAVQSGYPIDRLAAAGDAVIRGGGYLPWTSTVDLRLSRELGALPGCGGCAWRVSADARNLLGARNVIAVRRDTGGLAPSLEAVRRIAGSMPAPPPIPSGSWHYSEALDLDANGVITADEFRLARTAAAIDRFDPSLYYGAPRVVRLGVEVSW